MGLHHAHQITWPCKTVSPGTCTSGIYHSMVSICSFIFFGRTAPSSVLFHVLEEQAQYIVLRKQSRVLHFPSLELAGFEPGRWALCADHRKGCPPLESLKLHKAKTLNLLFLFYSQQHSLDGLQYQLFSCSILDTWELQQRIYPSGHWVILCWFLFFSFIFRQFAPPCPPETVLLHSSSSHLFSS